MPNIKAEGKTISCEEGANLRQVLIAHSINIYNGKAKYINLRSCT